jgi:hypothetical protein
MPRFVSAMTTGFIVVVVAALALSVYLGGPGVGPEPSSTPSPTDGSIDTLGRPLDWSQPNEIPTPRTSSVEFEAP